MFVALSSRERLTVAFRNDAGKQQQQMNRVHESTVKSGNGKSVHFLTCTIVLPTIAV